MCTRVYVIIGLVILLSLYLYTEKHMKIQGKQLYVFMQCTCIDINRESGESMQFLKVIEHATAFNNTETALWRPSWWESATAGHNFGKGPSNDYSIKVWF
jgi:hypothetical protein